MDSQISLKELMMLLGEKDVEIYTLLKQIEALQAEIARLSLPLKD
jgi:hypothetical protein